MIVPISLRDSHPNDRIIIKWIQSLNKSDRSRKIREILLSHIQGDVHKMKLEIGDSPKEERKETKIEMVDITGGEEELDLDSKLDLFGGGVL
jgi:hypothetical protein